MSAPTAWVALLDAGAGHDAEYAGGLSNHRPMALLALARLGANDSQLRNFDASYSRRLRPAPPAVAWPVGDAWASRLGQPEAWPLYRDLFVQWLDNEAAGDVLRQVLPTLMQGCGAAAFHGLIRTAYAVQAAHRQELADALAYWACRWLDLGSSDFHGTEADPERLLRQLRITPSDASLIFQRMQVAAAHTRCQATVFQLKVGPKTLNRLATLAARAYAASGNFTALHLVTSAHALRVLQPWLMDEPPVLDRAFCAYWRAFAAA
ncbi:MAG: questin oxidase family protein, partial [Rubrivivax sp.]|nr:questin oxidase family protein [Rubrivivax sp.]